MKSKQPTILNIHGQEFRECILYPKPINGKRDVRKNWMIRFYVTHLETNELKKVDLKKYNNIKSHQERLNKTKALMNDINKKLYLGYVFDAEIGIKHKLSTYTMRDDFRNYLSYLKTVKKLRPETVRTYGSGFKNVDNFLKNQKWEKIKTRDFNKSHAKAYYQSLLSSECSNGAKARLYLTNIRLFFDWYFAENDIERLNPFSSYSIKVKESDKHTPYSESEKNFIWEYLRATGQMQLLLFTKLIYYTFARPHKELRLLKVSDLRENSLFISGENNKSSFTKKPIMVKPLKELIEEMGIQNYPGHYYIFGKYEKPGPKVVNIHYFYWSFKKVLTHLNFNDNYTIYGFKHSGNISLFEHTGNLALVQNQNGHKSVNSTAKYLRKYAHNFKIDDFKNWN